MSSPNWKKIDSLLSEMREHQMQKLYEQGKKYVPGLTKEDLLQPNDFLALEHNALFRYEEGFLAGVQAVQIALRALQKEA